MELFGGIGACTKALKNIGMNVDVVDYVEIDKYAVKSYNAINDTNFEPQDITKWNKDIKVDLIMHGSPCQDISIAGLQAGADKDTGTRSSLMYETIRIVEKLNPKYVIWENVKNLLSKKHKHNFDNYIDKLEKLGYNSYYQVLNAKDYGIPQNRERVYTVSIRKDIDNGRFKFPEKEELKLRLKDMLEDEVEKKYYLLEYNLKLEENLPGAYGRKFGSKGKIEENICSTLQAAMGTGGGNIPLIKKQTKCIQVGKLDIKGRDNIKRVYSPKGISPTIDTMQGGNRQPKIITHNIKQIVKVRKYPVDTSRLVETLRVAKIEANKSNKELAEQLNVSQTQIEHYFRRDNSFAIPDPNIWYKLKEILNISTDEFDESIMTFEEKEGVYEKANRVYDENGLAPTLTQQEEKITNNIRIRKLTPLECWRLMGFDDEDFYKAQSIGNSNSQLYKQARKLNCSKGFRKNIFKFIKGELNGSQRKN